jgi:hypothetical protein
MQEVSCIRSPDPQPRDCPVPHVRLLCNFQRSQQVQGLPQVLGQVSRKYGHTVQPLTPPLSAFSTVLGLCV